MGPVPCGSSVGRGKGREELGDQAGEGGHGRRPGLEKPRGGGKGDWNCTVVIICQCGCITVILCLYSYDCVASEVCVVCVCGCLLWLSLCALIVGITDGVCVALL